MFRLFVQLFGRLMRKEFHAVRVADRPDRAVFRAPNLVIYTNHASWWDGVTFVFIADTFLAGRPVYTPVDAEMIERYRFVARIGAFGVQKGRLEGARRFLQACRLLFDDAQNVLLITAQGRFADIRERPLRLEGGIAHLVDLAPEAVFLPLAIEYTHWLEKQPELLLRFGQPIEARSLRSATTAARLTQLENALTQTMDALARDSIARDASAFETLASGKGGVHGFYDLWRRAVALASGTKFSASHGAPP